MAAQGVRSSCLRPPCLAHRGADSRCSSVSASDLSSHHSPTPTLSQTCLRAQPGTPPKASCSQQPQRPHYERAPAVRLPCSVAASVLRAGDPKAPPPGEEHPDCAPSGPLAGRPHGRAHVFSPHVCVASASDAEPGCSRGLCRPRPLSTEPQGLQACPRSQDAGRTRAWERRAPLDKTPRPGDVQVVTARSKPQGPELGPLPPVFPCPHCLSRVPPPSAPRPAPVLRPPFRPAYPRPPRIPLPSVPGPPHLPCSCLSHVPLFVPRSSSTLHPAPGCPASTPSTLPPTVLRPPVRPPSPRPSRVPSSVLQPQWVAPGMHLSCPARRQVCVPSTAGSRQSRPVPHPPVWQRPRDGAQVAAAGGAGSPVDSPTCQHPGAHPGGSGQ